MAKPEDHPGFKALESEWYQRLASEGFKDIEFPLGADRALKQTGTAKRYERLAPVVIETRIEYFDRICQLVAQTQFETDLEREILTLYAEGVSQVEIQDRLNLEGHRCKVYSPIYRWLEAWGLK